MNGPLTAGQATNLVEIPSQGIHEVTLVFLQHLHHGLQLRQPEALRQSAPGLESHSCPPQQVCALQRVRLQARLPQPGPETAAAAASPAEVRGAHARAHAASRTPHYLLHVMRPFL